MKDIRKKTTSGMKWNAIERLSILIFSFSINIILARLLSPSDYGIIGMLAVFISISEVFVNSGFGVALIQNKNRTEVDFSTAFYYNFFLSIIFYIILYFTSPIIASFYETPSLILITRVLGLSLIIGALGSLQNIKLIVEVDFKTQAKIALMSNLIAGSISIILAFLEFGVWVLVFQSLLSTLLMTIFRVFYVRWVPLLIFSKNSFKRLFGFGSKILLITLMDVMFNNLYNIIIGKKYTAVDLGYFTRANTFIQLPATNISSILEKVTFPVLSEIQDDMSRLSNNYRKILRMAAFIIFPTMMIIFVLTEPLVIFLLTDKWIEIIPFMQILCFSYILHPINVMNVNLLKVKGKTNILVKLEVVKKVMVTAIIFITMNFGVLGLCYGIVVSTFLSFIINSVYTGRIIGFGFIKQSKDLFPVFLISLFTALVIYLSILKLNSNLAKLFVGCLVGGCFYCGISHLFKSNELKELINILASKIGHKNKK